MQTVRIPAVYNLAEGNESAYYVIEYRQAIGLDWLFDELVDPEAGVLILLEEDEYLIGPVLLDVSPHTTTEVFSQLDDSADAYLSLGESFIDTGNGISITFSGLAAGAAVLTIDVPRVCGDGTCHPGEDSCNCPSDCGPPDPADCTLNDVPDECEPDCNNNGVADICEIADGASDDCPGGTGNGVPDECDPQVDCNSNGVIDSCDISGDTRGDLNANGIPDDCEFHAVIYVDMGNCPGPGSGTIQDPFCNIQDAIDAQDPGAGENEVVEIVLVDGIYTGDRNKNLDFAGRLITVRSINGPENCIIDMEGVGRGFNFHSGESAGARVEGLTIRNGLADASLDRIGGAIYCQESSPTIVDCTISGNTAESKGGGIYLESRSNPTIRDCRITNNSALPSGLGVTYGGGIYCEGSSPSISGCVISNNEAFGIFGTAGGGIALSRRSNPTIKACTIANNSTNGRGGGIRCEFNSSPTIRDCLIEGNLVVVSPDNHFLVGDGGGISASGSRLTIDRCTIKENAALHGGGISIGWDLVGGVVIRNCLITSNRASGGGGIRLTITGLGDTAAIENCTITENTRVGSFDGAGIFLWQNTLEQGMDVTNCILWGNRAAGNDISEAAQIGGFNEILAVNYSNIQGLTGALGGVGNIGDDPLFVSGTDQRLTECSPCIHAGNNLAVTASSDLDGNPRIVNGVVDMGAYELIGPPPVLCQPGTFNAAGGMACEEPCQPCPAGTFQPEEAGTECFPCAAGSFAGTPGTELCTPCPLGAFQLWPGQIECLACDPGTFAPTTGMLLCNPCPGETFQPSMGATQCDACDCDDNNICTTNDCHAATGSCENDLIAGCIPAASTWSLICLALLLVCVATILMPRALGRGR